MQQNKIPQSVLQPNTASALCYIPFVGWLGAIVMLIIEKNSVVRWNATQALLFMVGIWGLSAILDWTFILGFLIPLVWVAGMIVQLVLSVKVFQNEKMKLPIIGDWADRLINNK